MARQAIREVTHAHTPAHTHLVDVISPLPHYRTATVASWLARRYANPKDVEGFTDNFLKKQLTYGAKISQNTLLIRVDDFRLDNSLIGNGIGKTGGRHTRHTLFLQIQIIIVFSIDPFRSIVDEKVKHYNTFKMANKWYKMFKNTQEMAKLTN